MAVSATSIPSAALPRRENVWLRRAVNHVLIFAALIAAWEVGSRLGWLDPLTTPRPSDIASSIFTIYVDQKNIYWHFFVTFVEAMVGFVIGSAAGVGLAIVAALICFFPPFVNTVTGMLSVDEDAREMFRSLGATKSQIFWKLQLPGSMPIIMAGLKIAMSLALAGAIVGEFLSANQGMAVLIARYTYSLNMASSFAVLLSLTALGFILFKVAEFADSRIVFWNHDDRLAEVGRKRKAAWQAGGRR